ncbi:MAG: hypothetical protein Q7S27_06290 [Nanoarchaeota archaeon]|nr:hypothetical protein [Nanoarchaeota archaeon]
MKCSKCGNQIEIQLGSKVNFKGCKILTEITSIVSVQCEKCNNIFQVSISSKSLFSVKKDN